MVEMSGSSCSFDMQFEELIHWPRPIARDNVAFSQLDNIKTDQFNFAPDLLPGDVFRRETPLFSLPQRTTVQPAKWLEKLRKLTKL